MTTEEMNALDTSCDGMFFILDTAKHNGWTPDSAEIAEHIRECRECFDRNSDLIN